MIAFEKLNIRKKRSNSKIVAFSVFVTVMFACLFLLQERTYAVACYTDTWADDSGVSEQVYFEGEEIDGPYIVGSGVTHMEYFEPYHEASVVTTLTSPSGQQITGYDSDWWGYYKQSFTARAEVELLWNANEVGTYTINSEHFSYCPETNFGPTQSSFPIGITYLKMGLINCDQFGCYYERVEPCNVYCRTMLRNSVPASRGFYGQYIAMEIPYGPFGCLLFVRVHRNSTPFCYDVGWN